MIKMGLVYGNLMSNLQPNNEKLVGRARGILAEEARISEEEAARVFELAGRDLRLALLIACRGVSRDEAEALLKAHGNSARRAIDSAG